MKTKTLPAVLTVIWGLILIGVSGYHSSMIVDGLQFFLNLVIFAGGAMTVYIAWSWLMSDADK